MKQSSKREAIVKTFDINNFKSTIQNNNRYKKRIAELQGIGFKTDYIKSTVDNSIKNINQKNARSFIIYGEPQSGKTEMMIALTAKLLDEGHRIIIHLLNDSIDLLNQNLQRSKASGISPSPKLYLDIIDSNVKVGNNEFVLFCKKNAGDLQRLINKVGHINGKVIIDDEADYASPNGKINKGEKTKINALIESLLGNGGIYIGVTATPARLDLNNTFKNDHEKWVVFPPHEKYTGQDVFFPLNSNTPPLGFKLFLLTDVEDSPKIIKESLFRFIINVAHINLFKNKKNEKNYSMLIHTSRKKVDHKSDKNVIEKVLDELSNEKSSKYEQHVKQIWDFAKKLYPGKQDQLTKYIVNNKNRVNIVLLNSDRNNPNLEEASNPISLFTIIIGGNIVSRGVTFNNLLSVFFTRDVRYKIQQDTYIQRARMFGARGDYLKYFELTIPETLYADWHRCFVFHRLAIAAIQEGKRAPVWLSDDRISTASASSIDHSTVSLERGEMGFALINFNSDKEKKYEQIINKETDSFVKMQKLKKLLSEGSLPDYLVQYINTTALNNPDLIAIHPASNIDGYKNETGLDKKKIERVKGFFGTTQLQKNRFPEAIHHIKLFYNKDGKARLFYKFNGSVLFIRNWKRKIGIKNND